MKEVVGITPQSVTELYRPDHEKDAKYHVHTVIHDDAIIEKNKRIRLESLLTRRSKFDLHHGERLDFAFQIPQDSWAFFKKSHPDIAKGLIAKDEQVRYESARKLAILHPEWAILAANR